MAERYGSVADTKVRPGAHVIDDDAPHSRSVYVVTGGNYPVATVMGQVAADKKLKPVDAAAADGTENAHSVLFRDCDAALVDADGLVSEYHSVLRADLLVWPEGATQGQIDGWLDQLKAKHIKVK